MDVLQTHSDSEHDEIASQSTQLLELIDEMQEQSNTSDSHSQVFNGILKQVGQFGDNVISGLVQGLRLQIGVFDSGHHLWK